MIKNSITKIAFTFVILASALAGLLWSSLREGTEYYKHVDEVVVSPKQWDGKALQLHGFVVPGSILVRPNTLEYRFQIQNRGSIIAASYTGVVPDTFKDDSEVVLKGRLTNQVFLVSKNGVMAKCPSKYDAK